MSSRFPVLFFCFLLIIFQLTVHASIIIYLVFYLAAISHPDDTLGLRYSANRVLCSPPFSLM